MLCVAGDVCRMWCVCMCVCCFVCVVCVYFYVCLGGVCGEGVPVSGVRVCVV